MERDNRSGLSIEELRSVVHALAEADASSSTTDNNASNSSLLSTEEQHFLTGALASHERQSSRRQVSHMPSELSTASPISRPSSTAIARVGLGPSYAISPSLEPSSASSSSSTSPLPSGDTIAASFAPSRLPAVPQSLRTYSSTESRNAASRPPLSSSTSPPTSYRLREQKSGGQMMNSNSRSTEPTPGAYSVAERASGAPPAWDWRSRQPGSYLYPPGTSADIIQAVEGRFPSRNFPRANTSERRPPIRTISPIPTYGASSPVQATLAPSGVQPTRLSSSSESSSCSDPTGIQAGTRALNEEARQTDLALENPSANQRNESGNTADTAVPPSQPVVQEAAPSTMRSEIPVNETTLAGITISNKRRSFSLWYAGALVLCLIVGIAVGVVVMSIGNGADETAQSDTEGHLGEAIPISRQDRWTQFRKRMQPLSSDPSNLDDPTTPQYQALAWLAFDDDETMLIETDRVTQEMFSDEDAKEAWFKRLESRYALAVLYFATNGQKWNGTYDFLSSTSHECYWSNPASAPSSSDTLSEAVDRNVVECDESFQLKSLVMSGNNMAGTIPNEILALSSLEVLDLSRNALSSTIPSMLVRLSELETLNLGHNDLSGTFPISFTLLTNLREFNVTNNRLHGKMNSRRNSHYNNPWPLWHALEVLDISHNALEGPVPSDVKALISLREFHFGHNLFSDNLPVHFGDLRRLAVIDGSHNNITGPFPWDSVGRSEATRRIDMSHNRLSAILPPSDVDRYKIVSTLEYLDLSHNVCDDCAEDERRIPEALAKLTSLKELRLSDINAVGTIPSSLGRLKELQVLDLSSNQLSSTLPKELLRLTSLRLAHFESNELEGDAEFLCSLFPYSDDTNVAVDGAHSIGIVTDCSGNDPEVSCSSCCRCPD